MLCLRIFTTLLLATTATLLTSCGRKSDPVTAAQNFFELLGSGRTAEAYENSAFGFKAHRSLRIFEQTSREMGLTEFASATWEQPEIKNQTAKLRGELVTKNGGKMPIVVTLNEESGQWRVFALRSPRSVETGLVQNRFSLLGKGSSFTDPLSQPMPDEQTIRQLALETLLKFNDAIARNSFDQFYENVSRAWQAQLTIGQLQRAFQPFVDKKVNIAHIADAEPSLKPPPHINTDGLLVISGEYPTEPYRVVFTLKYNYELPKWRLFGIDVQLRK